jgi:hypothetical protein
MSQRGEKRKSGSYRASSRITNLVLMAWKRQQEPQGHSSDPSVSAKSSHSHTGGGGQVCLMEDAVRG